MENKEATTTLNLTRHPIEKTNCIFNIFYLWTIPTFIKGMKKDIDEDDLYKPLASHESSILGDQLDEVWSEEKKRRKKYPSLLKALLKTFRFDFIKTASILVFMEFVIKLSVPILIGKLMSYYKPNQIEISKTEAFIYATLIVTAKLLNIILQHVYMLGLKVLGMKLRVSCCSLIYRKALKLSKTSLAKTTLGQMVNLLSNDVQRFDRTMIHIHSVWVTPIETLVYLYFLYAQSGWTAMSGIALLILLVPLQTFVGKKTSVYRHRTAVRTDERVRLMNEIVTGIQVIKMYCWEIPFAKLVEIVRKFEIREIKKNCFLRAIIISFTMFVDRTAVYLCIIAYTFSGHIPDAQYVYVVISFYEILRQPITMALPQAIQSVAEMKVCTKRIQNFLLYDELEKLGNTNCRIETKNGTKELIPLLATSVNEDSKDVGITIKNGSAKWIETSTYYHLNNINIYLSSKQLVAVVGPVGSGKTSLLHVILGELPLAKGTIDVFGRVSYASQEPWLFSSSIRQNILFGEPMERKKYDEVVRVCALERDFSLFTYGDKTLVGERGVALSGGQKARINLARAIYKDADIYLLDDPLSAVDTHVGKQLFNDCISNYLKDKCTILVTHQLQYLKNVDKIFLVENGEIIASGTYQELKSSGEDYTKLLNDDNEEKEDNENEKEDESELNLKNIIKGTPQEVKEHKSIGSVSKNVYGTYFRSGGTICRMVLMFSFFVAAQILASSCDYFITYWLNLEQYRIERKYLSTNTSLTGTYTNATIPNDVLLNYSDVAWSANNSTVPSVNISAYYALPGESFLTTNVCISIYSVIILSIITVTLTRSFTFYNYCMRVSENLHHNLFNKIVYAPMRFFNVHSSGRILNRFSKDIGTIDEGLPAVILDTIQIGLQMFAVTAIIAAINPWILPPTAIIFVVFYLFKIFYLRTSRSVKRLEGITKSPVFSHLSASLQGITTIRAFGAESILEKEFDNHQDLHTSAYFMFLACTRSFGMWLDLLCIGYVATVTFGLLVVGKEKYGGNIGLSMTQAMALTGLFQWGMRQWCEVENQMTSVERVIEYTEIEPEKENKTTVPPENWPAEGKIEFKSVYLKYAPTEPHILRDLNFTINPQEKIGIVGRTGAGKTSLIAALFRLTDLEGDILIDEINTSSVSLHKVRSKIAIIPQEPVLFSGTLRKNLDPFEEYDDATLWNALERVELKEVVSESPEGINCPVAEGGSNFSVGQRQLICLARAIIRNNKILILDEATANVDPRTDALIQATIRKQFDQCTVLTIAHRLHTVMDSSRILVMDAGRVVEFDIPYRLLLDSNGYLSNLVKETGTAMADNLFIIAKQNYENSIQK